MAYKTKYQALIDSYQDGLKDISSSPKAWRHFLDSAAYTYMQPFRNQVVLHKHSAGIKAVASYNDWKKLNRHVEIGKNGILVFDPVFTDRVVSLFDYNDTTPFRSLPSVLPWTVYPAKSGIALHNLLRKAGEASLDSYIHARVSKVGAGTVKPDDLPKVQKCLEQSMKYVLHTRLGMPTDTLDVSAFSFVTQISNQPTAVENLGASLRQIMKECVQPLRGVAYAMHMTMPSPESLSRTPSKTPIQEKNTVSPVTTSAASAPRPASETKSRDVDTTTGRKNTSSPSRVTGARQATPVTTTNTRRTSPRPPSSTPHQASQQDTFEIWQLRPGSQNTGLLFPPYAMMKGKVKKSNYNLVYSAPLKPGMNLDSIINRFNHKLPKDFKGHSVSSSDVIVLHRNGKETAHYVDFSGFQDVPEFMQEPSSANSPRRYSADGERLWNGKTADQFRAADTQRFITETQRSSARSYQQLLERRAHMMQSTPEEIDVEGAAQQAGLAMRRDLTRPGAGYFDADQNMIHVSDAGSENEVLLGELKGYADAVIQCTATTEPEIRDLESVSLAVMLAARCGITGNEQMTQQLAVAYSQASRRPAFDLAVTLQRLDNALDYCDQYMERAQEQKIELDQGLSLQSQAFLMGM